MTKNVEDIEGYTLSVYAYIAHAKRAVGTREVTRGANLSSPSVAHRHLQKLEDLGLIEKNQYGDYILKEKASVKGQVWIGKNLVPRLMFYAFFFIGLFSVEIGVIVFSLLTKSVVIQANFLLLTAITALAMTLFLIEGLILHQKFNRQ